MAFQPLLRQRAIMPTAIAATALTTLLYPRTTAHAEAPPTQPQPTRKPIYDSLPPLRQEKNSPQRQQPTPEPSTSTPTPTARLATQIARLRLTLHTYSTTTEEKFNLLTTHLLSTERTLTSTLRTLRPPPSTNETLMPSTLYILLSSMTTTLITRNRSLLLRATLPGIVGLGAAWTLLPHTMRNAGDLVWRWEERVPVVAENHLRVRGAVGEGWRVVREGGEAVGGWGEGVVREGRERVEGWVRKGR